MQGHDPALQPYSVVLTDRPRAIDPCFAHVRRLKNRGRLHKAVAHRKSVQNFASAMHSKGSSKRPGALSTGGIPGNG